MDASLDSGEDSNKASKTLAIPNWFTIFLDDDEEGAIKSLMVLPYEKSNVKHQVRMRRRFLRDIFQ
jgi:hypothetical protein